MNATISREDDHILVVLTNIKGETSTLRSARGVSERNTWYPVESMFRWVARKELYLLTNPEPECADCGGYGISAIGSSCPKDECGGVRKKLAQFRTDGYFTTEQLDLVPEKYKHLFKTPA